MIVGQCHIVPLSRTVGTPAQLWALSGAASIDVYGSSAIEIPIGRAAPPERALSWLDGRARQPDARETLAPDPRLPCRRGERLLSPQSSGLAARSAFSTERAGSRSCIQANRGAIRRRSAPVYTGNVVVHIEKVPGRRRTGHECQ